MPKHNHLFRKTANKILPTLSAVALLFSPASVLAGPPSGQWQLKFSDDFNGTSLDESNWGTCYFWATDSEGCSNGGAGELQWFERDNVSVNNGTLRLSAQKQKSNGKQYTSGMISSYKSFAFQYGYVEMRAKIPKGNGLWPNFWMLPKDKTWPPELDIAEFVGSNPTNVHMSLHYDDGKGHTNSTGWWGGKEGMDFSKGYHTYAVQWEPDKIIWYVDGVERRRYTGAMIPNKPMYVVANLPVAPAWTVPPDSSTPFPSTFDIDYIKVWQR